MKYLFDIYPGRVIFEFQSDKVFTIDETIRMREEFVKIAEKYGEPPKRKKDVKSIVRRCLYDWESML